MILSFLQYYIDDNNDTNKNGIFFYQLITSFYPKIDTNPCSVVCKMSLAQSNSETYFQLTLKLEDCTEGNTFRPLMKQIRNTGLVLF